LRKDLSGDLPYQDYQMRSNAPQMSVNARSAGVQYVRTIAALGCGA
jgi:hypothetical protein